MLFQLPNGMEFMRQLRSSKMKVRHQEDINALALCDQADRNVYPILEKYSKEMSVDDILEIHPDPEGYFGNEGRKVSNIYRLLSFMHLKKEFRLLSSAHIKAVWKQKNYLYYPSFKESFIILISEFHSNLWKLSCIFFSTS